MTPEQHQVLAHIASVAAVQAHAPGNPTVQAGSSFTVEWIVMARIHGPEAWDLLTKIPMSETKAVMGRLLPQYAGTRLHVDGPHANQGIASYSFEVIIGTPPPVPSPAEWAAARTSALHLLGGLEES